MVAWIDIMSQIQYRNIYSYDYQMMSELLDYSMLKNLLSINW